MSLTRIMKSLLYAAEYKYCDLKQTKTSPFLLFIYSKGGRPTRLSDATL